jgi:diguanylate cyclase (GGDEF)-like protein/PAS domain S-box-containing protein
MPDIATISGNSKRRLNIQAGVAACLTTLLLALLSTGNVLAETREVRVGLYQNAPKIFRADDGQPSGILVDLLEEIAKQEAWRLVYIPCEWQACLKQLHDGRIDLMPDVAYSDPRNLQMDFHQTPALHDWSQIYRSEQAQISTFLDLKEKRVALLDGGIQQENFSTMMRGFGITPHIVPTRSYEEAFKLVQSGKADAAITNHHFGERHAAQFSLKDTGLYFNPALLFYTTAQGRNADLLRGIEHHLSFWSKDSGSRYFQILKRWGSPEPAPATPQLVKMVMWFFLAVLIASGLAVVALRRRLKMRTRHLRDTRSHLQSMLDALPDLMFEVDLNGRYVDYHSPRSDLLVAPANELIGKTLHEVMPQEAAETCMAALREANARGRSHGKQIVLDLSDGRHWFELSVSRMALEKDQAPHFIVLSHDMTGRKEAEDKIERLTKLYAALSMCNQAIVRCASEEELLPIICRDVVDFGGMKMAWIGMLDRTTGLIRPVASFGTGTDYLEGLEISADADKPSGRGPTGTCFRENRPYWCQDYRHDPATSIWHDRAALFGWGSSASLPILRKGEVVAAFTLYAQEVGAFDDAARNLLTEMAMDISYALDRFADDAFLMRTTQELRDKDELYRTAFYTSPDAINITRIGDGMYLDVNEGFEHITGWQRDEVIGRTSLEISVWHEPADRMRLVEALQQNGICENLEAEFVRKDGSRLTGLMSAQRIELKGEPCILSITRDISNIRSAESDLRKLSLAVEQSPNSIVITDLDANIEYTNQTFTRISGYRLDEVIGKNPRMFQSGKTQKATYADLWAHLSAGKAWSGELVNLRKDGSEYIEYSMIAPVRQPDGRVTHYLAIKEDVTEKKRNEERIEHLAHFDQLTGLPNRSQLNDRFGYALSLAQRSGDQLAVMFLDLDHFKDINDTLGHSVGDRYLMEVAMRLKATLREEDTVSRMGGDEFILLFPGTHADGAAIVAGKLIHAVSQPFHVDGHELIGTPSIGIAMYPDDGATFEELLKNADTAMYRVKQAGRNDYRFFTPEMQAHSARTLQLANALRHALARNELQLHYQPQVTLSDGHVIGAEALLRWQHPEMGSISPAEFIPVAEDSGQIIAIGEWVLRTAVNQMKAWLDAGMPPMVVAVNLSAIQFRQPNLPALVNFILDEAGLPHEYLELELTEAVAMDDPQAAVEIMNSLHASGIRMSIDDFGTGYSSLSYLKKFKVYKLKIDQSFVRDISDDPEDKAIVSAIINMASSLGMHTIAEGVETAGQLAFLRLQGCDEVQGYYFSKPLPAPEFEAYLRKQSV